MGTGAITQYIDVAQVAFYIFLLFFIGLVIYLTLEGKREGFPLETERYGKVRHEDGILGMPRPITYKTEFGKSYTAPLPTSIKRMVPSNLSHTRAKILASVGWTKVILPTNTMGDV